MRECLQYPRVRKHIPLDDDEREAWLDALPRLAEGIEDPPLPPVGCRDPDDDKYLAVAVAGRADHLASGDRDLLDLRVFQGIGIVTPAAFLRILQRSRAEGSRTSP